METFNQMRERLVSLMGDWAEDCASSRFVDDGVIEDLVDELLEEVGEWEKEHGVLTGIANPELLEEVK